MLLLLQIFLFTVFIKKKKISSWSWLVFLTGYHQIWWQRDQQVSVFSQGWRSGWWPHQGHCLWTGSGEDWRHSNQENLLWGLHKEWVYLVFGSLCLFFFNKNKVSVEIFKDHYSENVSCYAILWFFHQVSCFYLTYEFSIQKKNASQRELTQSWFMCISLSISIYSWNVIQWVGRLVLWVCADLFW